MAKTVISQCREIIDREIRRLYSEQPNLSIDEIMAVISSYKQKPHNGGMFRYSSWSRAMHEQRLTAEKAYPHRVR